MNQFVTTYRRDYLWPYTKALGNRRVDYSEIQPSLAKTCECPYFNPKRDDVCADDAKEQNWSRIGPMGPLLDPKLYPVKVGKSPESAIMRLNQPDRFMVKLEQKYPYLYEVIKTAPPTDLIAKVNEDRYFTTYQIDYCSAEALPDYFNRGLMNSPQIEPCPEPTKLPGDTNRPPKGLKMSAISKSKGGGGIGGGSGGGGGSGAGGGVGGKSGDGGAWGNKSEYQDGISRLGGIIVRDKLHYHSSRKV